MEAPDVALHATLAPELVLHQVGVVRGGDEVMAERLVQVLEETAPPGVLDGALRRAQVHQEAVKGHGVELLG